ncbi:IS110 family transposase [Macrococcoides canis]|uniref:IS110 family transposase n=1 Tax=Macrococcoides canis TaxID=1855823 RepID=UPI0013E91904|nr:IS110 family transposase [Macrococcus canis]QIH76142.1 IS110 family transposase [Macrococcus canis]QIH76463.1 IS110 family transposase [Macrococcus canis]QIH76564.1 IS110 family transposase [Macrococcus canis]QIH76939.1 IS110 family transposase [Macrococcus canis]
MQYLGIDIGKRAHEAALLDQDGNHLGKTVRFSNSHKGAEKLLDLINEHECLPDNTLIGMEATGHYWLSIHTFLKKLGFDIVVFNPIQSDSFRNFYIRKTKTDKVDAVLIAQVIRMDVPNTSYISSEDTIKLKQLTRFRVSMVDQTSDIKRQIISCLDQVFPEYERLFSDMFGKTSRKLLLESPLPEDLLNIESTHLTKLLKEASKGRFTEEKSMLKVDEIKGLASDSFGISIASDVFKMQIQLLIQQIELLESQIKDVESKINELLEKDNHHLTTITGIGPITAATIIGEIGDIKRFERPNQLLAFAGLDASIYQSGDFTGTNNRISKRGSPYLRRAIWQAAFVASNKDPALSEYYQSLRARGKHHGTAIGAVCRKLVNIIFAVWTNDKPYEVRHHSNKEQE